MGMGLGFRLSLCADSAAGLGCAQVEFNNQTLDKRCMSTVQLLIDIESLSHTDYMTGTLNSGIPYLIEARPPLQPTTALCPTIILLTWVRRTKVQAWCGDQGNYTRMLRLSAAPVQ